MSLTISASAGDDKVCSVTNRASLPSCAPASTLRRSTNSAPSSAQRVIPGSYSDSQVGQNIIWFQVSGFKFKVKISSRQFTASSDTHQDKTRGANLKP